MDKGERGFYLLPEDLAAMANLVAEGKTNKIGSKLLMDEIILRNKNIAKKAYEILLEKNLIKNKHTVSAHNGWCTTLSRWRVGKRKRGFDSLRDRK